jgi:integrase
MLFTEFLDTIYLPVCLPKLASSTQNRSRGVIRPRFGQSRLASITVLDVDRFLTTLSARDLTHESLDKIRDVLSGVFSAAVRYGYLDRNPARGLRLPRAKLRRAHRAWITPAQLAEIVAGMAEPYATMVYTAAWTGLRVSELIGLRWRNVGADSITVAERCCRGDWGEAEERRDDPGQPGCVAAGRARRARVPDAIRTPHAR